MRQVYDAQAVTRFITLTYPRLKIGPFIIIFQTSPLGNSEFNFTLRPARGSRAILRDVEMQFAKFHNTHGRRWGFVPRCGNLR